MPYEDMRSEELMDKAVTVISGVGTSVSFYNMITGEKILNIFFWVVLSFAIFILQLSKIILLYIRRYRFYLIILKQFKQELDIVYYA